MNPSEFEKLMKETFADQKLSRKEKRLIKDILADEAADEQKLGLYQQKAFAIARESLGNLQGEKVLGWLEGVVKVLHQKHDRSAQSEVWFSPEHNCPGKIASLIHTARRKIDICVFTITDDRIAGPIFDAHRRGITIRIATDNEKLHDPGSDIKDLAAAGIPVRIDQGEHHMHHKFALFDDETLLTGSYNWTRGAAKYNEENFIVTGDVQLVKAYRVMFEKLWGELTPFE